MRQLRIKSDLSRELMTGDGIIICDDIEEKVDNLTTPTLTVPTTVHRQRPRK